MSNSNQSGEGTATYSLLDFFYFLKRQWFYFVAVPILLFIGLRFSPQKVRDIISWLFIAAIFLGLCSFLLMALWHIPRWQVNHLQDIGLHDKFTLENEARKTIAQVMGGVLLLASFYFTWENLRITQDNTQKTQRITQEGQITERFSKSVDQLGNDKPTVRLGGIYALERISKDSEKDHWAVIEVLISSFHEKASLLQNDPLTHAQFKADIQAILTVIGRRGEGFSKLEPQRIDLRATNLQRTKLNGANLTNIDFEGALLRDANLSGANLSNSNLKNADFSNAHLNQANFKDAYMEGTILTNAILDGVNIDEVNLEKVIGLTWQQVERTTTKRIYVTPRLPPELIELWSKNKMKEMKDEINSR